MGRQEPDMTLSSPVATRRPQWIAVRPGVLGLYAAFAVVTLADSLVTGLGISLGMRELMPVTGAIASAYGAAVLPLTKLPVLALGAAAVRALPWRWARPLLATVSAVTLLAVVWDCVLIYRIMAG